MSLDSRSLSSLKYFSIKVRLLEAATVLVVIVMPFYDSLMQSMLMLDLYDLRKLLIWLTWVLAWFRILPLLVASIRMRMFFLERSFVVI